MASQILHNPLNAIRPLVHAVGRPGRPLFLVHGVDGEVGWFLRHLTGQQFDRPVYGVVAPGWYGEDMPSSLSLLAARHVQRIREMQPTGPYTLGGYSVGAQVTLEMAAQMESAGDEVDELLLIDPIINRRRRDLEPSDLVHFRLHQLRRRRHPVMQPYFELADKLSPADVIEGMNRSTLPDTPVLRRFYRGMIVHIAIACVPRSSPRPVSVRQCLVLRDCQRLPASTSDDPNASALSSIVRGPLRVSHVPGPHARMFEQPSLHRALAICASRVTS